MTDAPNEGTLVAAQNLLTTAREVHARGETETTSALLDEVDRLLDVAWGPDPRLHWPRGVSGRAGAPTEPSSSAPTDGPTA